MLNKYLKSNLIVEILLSLTFIINLFISEISNYKLYSFYLKGISTIVLFFLTWIDYRERNVELVKLNPINYKMFLTTIALFILIPTFSLIYSYNIKFGIMKIGYLFISTIPAIFVFAYILLTANRERISVFLNVLLFTGLIFGIFSLIISPYNPLTKYSFELSRWSHVIAGRFLSSITVIILFLHFSNFIKSRYLLNVVSIILFISTYFVGLRAAFLGIILVIIVLLLYSIIYRKKKELISISISLLFATIGIILISQINQTSTDRYSKLETYKNGKFDDGAINARLIAYKSSWENIKEYPILGVGFGGFNKKEISGGIADIKYPHNLFIEIQLELGIIGTVIGGILLGLLFWKAYKFSIPLFLFFLFSLWLAMFSKDIATQTQLWIGMALIGIKKKNK